jgi:hypothetical protein
MSLLPVWPTAPSADLDAPTAGTVTIGPDGLSARTTQVAAPYSHRRPDANRAATRHRVVPSFFKFRRSGADLAFEARTSAKKRLGVDAVPVSNDVLAMF